MKQVRETKAGKSISAWVILKDGEQVAQVQAHYSDSGVVQVDCWAAPEWGLMQGKASGYGYDKLTAALSGMVIDGQRIYDHCASDEKTEAILQQYKDGELDEQTFRRELSHIGATYSNWAKGRWQSAHYLSGLSRLKELGYKVIQAI